MSRLMRSTSGASAPRTRRPVLTRTRNSIKPGMIRYRVVGYFMQREGPGTPEPGGGRLSARIFHKHKVNAHG